MPYTLLLFHIIITQAYKDCKTQGTLPNLVNPAYRSNEKYQEYLKHVLCWHKKTVKSLEWSVPSEWTDGF
jgi:hypothetical protein